MCFRVYSGTVVDLGECACVCIDSMGIPCVYMEYPLSLSHTGTIATLADGVR